MSGEPLLTPPAPTEAARPRLLYAQPEYDRLTTGELLNIIRAQQEHYTECVCTCARLARLTSPDLCEAILALGATYGLTTGHLAAPPSLERQAVREQLGLTGEGAAPPGPARRELVPRLELADAWLELLRENPSAAFGRRDLEARLRPRAFTESTWTLALADTAEHHMRAGTTGDGARYMARPTTRGRDLWQDSHPRGGR